jgi:pyruvate/2-oxoglutarate dehydrogenase complex dihydrolipoamide acyltransferase (E2) component
MNSVINEDVHDHPVIDGKEAGPFLVTINDLIEDPAHMLLGV